MGDTVTTVHKKLYGVIGQGVISMLNDPIHLVPKTANGFSNSRYNAHDAYLRPEYVVATNT